jgi:hypothetical protein
MLALTSPREEHVAFCIICEGPHTLYGVKSHTETHTHTHTHTHTYIYIYIYIYKMVEAR